MSKIVNISLNRASQMEPSYTALEICFVPFAPNERLSRGSLEQAVPLRAAKKKQLARLCVILQIESLAQMPNLISIWNCTLIPLNQTFNKTSDGNYNVQVVSTHWSHGKAIILIISKS